MARCRAKSPCKARRALLGRRVKRAAPCSVALYTATEQGAARLPNLRFHGQLRVGATRALFSNARVFVNTSSFEGFPNTYLQAWANGVPVVATFDPDGVIARHGLGVAVRDAAGIVAAARALLASPETWAACSARCRQYAHKQLAPASVAAPYIAALTGGVDAGYPGAGQLDAGRRDAGRRDAAHRDAGRRDAAHRDAGRPTYHDHDDLSGP